MSKVDDILDRHLNDKHGAGQTYRDITNALKEIAELSYRSGWEQRDLNNANFIPDKETFINSLFKEQ